MNKRVVLTKDQIIAVKDIGEKEWVDVPEWGENAGTYVKYMTAKEKDDYEVTLTKEVSAGRRGADFSNMRAKLCAFTMVNEKGELIFNPYDSKDIDALGDKSVKAMDRVFSVARRLNSVTDSDLEEMEKNLKKIQSEDSNSD